MRRCAKCRREPTNTEEHMKLEQLATRVTQLVAQADAVLCSERSNEYGPWVDDGLFAGFRASGLSFIQNLFGDEHPYYRDFDKRCTGANPSDTRQGREILNAISVELSGGWFATARGLVSAELFADFLEMAGYLLEEGYKDAAAVMIGSVLEERLRQLAVQHEIPLCDMKNGASVPRKADTLNADLGNIPAYNKLDQKSITAWLDLRNKAAHGKYAEFTVEQVRLMHQGVLDFMTRVAP